MNQHTFEKVKEVIINHLEISPDEVKPETELIAGLGADSLDRVEITMKLEDVFEVEIQDADIAEANTVEDVVNIIEKAKQ